MIDRFISQNINKLTTNNIDEFLKKQNIILTAEELNTIYNYIMSNWYTLIYNNPENIFIELKNKIRTKEYNQLINMYYEYKERYKDYL